MTTNDDAKLPDLGDRVTALETGFADLSKRLETLAASVAAIPASAGLTTDDLNNATHPLADDIANLRAAVSDMSAQLTAAPPETVAALNADDQLRNAWIDNVLHKFFSGEIPAPVDDTGRTG